MNWKNTWILVGLAAALFAFIFLFERRISPGGAVQATPPLFAQFRPSSATSLQVRRGTLTLALERSNGAWQFTRPTPYPAANFSVQNFLESLERTVPATFISASEIRHRKQTRADFGFDPPPVVIVLQRGDERPELRIGARTAAGDQVYVEVDGQTGYFVVSAEILDRLPRTQNDWRDTALFHFADERVERAEIAHGGAGFALAVDPTNKLWRLVRPQHRADQLQVRQLLDKLQTARATEFVTDDPRADLETFGLQTPEYELTLAGGAVTQKVQFGRSPTNDPGRIYARLLERSNVVLVASGLVELLATPYSDLREKQLVSFAPELVDVIEFRAATNSVAITAAEESFVVRKNATGAWVVAEGPADPLLISRFLELLSQLRVTVFVKDVVEDFASYGLQPPQRRYTLRTTITNAAGATNVVVAQLEFGTNAMPNQIFARRWDENSVYEIRLGDYGHLPTAGWQLREHRVWRFTTNQVSKITVQQGNEVHEVIRQSNVWIGVKGVDPNPNPFALEEFALRLGELNTEAWVGRGEGARAQFGFTTNFAVLSVELRGEKPQTLTIEFGGMSPVQWPYALTMFDGQPSVFEFPFPLYYDLQRYFNLAPPPGYLRAPNAPR